MEKKQEEILLAAFRQMTEQDKKMTLDYVIACAQKYGLKRPELKLVVGAR